MYIHTSKHIYLCIYICICNIYIFYVYRSSCHSNNIQGCKVLIYIYVNLFVYIYIYMKYLYMFTYTHLYVYACYRISIFLYIVIIDIYIYVYPILMIINSALFVPIYTCMILCIYIQICMYWNIYIIHK
jgi:hypothetical protein